MFTAWDIASQERDAQLAAHQNGYRGIVMGDPDGFHAVEIGSGYFKLMPGPEFNSWIFRGQSQIYNPCFPSLYRGGSDKLEIFIEKLKCVQFKELVSNHPSIIDSCKNINVMSNHLWIDYEGLAQHYGLKTELFDFTSDPWVAAFFAVSRFDPESGRYLPVRTGSEPGVFYRFNTIFHLMDIKNSDVDIIGLQPLRRPGEQKAFSIRVKKGHCLHKIPTMTSKKFRHDTKVSERILDRFSGDSDLLPEDPVAAKALQISASNLFSYQAFSECVEKSWPGADRRSLIKRLRRRGIAITVEKPYSFTRDELDVMREDWLNRRNDFLSSIKFRVARYV